MTSDRHTDIQTDRQTYILPLVVLSAALQQKRGVLIFFFFWLYKFVNGDRPIGRPIFHKFEIFWNWPPKISIIQSPCWTESAAPIKSKDNFINLYSKTFFILNFEKIFIFMIKYTKIMILQRSLSVLSSGGCF